MRSFTHISILLFLFICSYTTVKAESEPNNTSGSADTLAVNGSQTGNVSSGDSLDWYSLKLTQPGKLTLKFVIDNKKMAATVTLRTTDTKGIPLKMTFVVNDSNKE